MVAKICNAYHFNKISTSKYRQESHLPRLNDINDVWALVNATIIYHDYRVWDRKWLHLIQGMFHEFVEGCSVEGTFNEYLKQYSLSYMHYMISICVPFPLTEKDFPGSFHPMYSPCTTSVCCMMINCTFINENELVWLIHSYTSCEYGVLLHTLFKCCVRKLKLLSTSDICS